MAINAHLTPGTRTGPHEASVGMLRIVQDLAGTLDAAERRPACRGIDPLMQHRRAVAADVLDVVLSSVPPRLDLGEVEFLVLVVGPRPGAHEEVGADEIGLAGGAEALAAPAPAAGDDVVDLLD